MSEWGKGVLNNNIGWGQGFNNTINWGDIYASSYTGQTVISEILNLQSIIDNFKTRVANDGGTFEAESNLLSILTSVNNDVGLSKVNMLLTPNAFKTSKAYNVIGATDFTMLRNTSATRVNSASLIELQGSNIMRINYSSATPMILDELQKTNLITYSEDYTDSSWSKFNISVNSSVVAAPFVNKFGVKINATASSGDCALRKSQAGNQLSHSIYGKKGEINFLIFRTSVNGSFANVSFNLNTGTIDVNEAPSFFTAKIENAGNGWYRCSVYIVSNSTSNFMIWDISNTTSNNFSGFIGQGLFLFGAQQEASIVPTSYIPTVASAVTRNDDLLTVTTPVGTVKITTTFLDNTTQVLTTIPATFTLPAGQIRQTVFQKLL